MNRLALSIPTSAVPLRRVGCKAMGMTSARDLLRAGSHHRRDAAERGACGRRHRPLGVVALERMLGRQRNR